MGNTWNRLICGRIADGVGVKTQSCGGFRVNEFSPGIVSISVTFGEVTKGYEIVQKIEQLVMR